MSGGFFVHFRHVQFAIERIICKSRQFEDVSCEVPVSEIYPQQAGDKIFYTFI
jgi:hypothetical protein